MKVGARVAPANSPGPIYLRDFPVRILLEWGILSQNKTPKNV